MKQKPLPKPTPLQLARLTATLASIRRDELEKELPILGAEKLWYACASLFEKTVAQDRHGLKIEELAFIASLLAYGKPLRDIDRRRAAEKGLRLWQNCKRRLAPRPISNADFASLSKQWADDSRLRPGRFPCPLKKALLLWMPQKRTKQRREKFKNYLRDSFSLELPSDFEPDGEQAFFVPIPREVSDIERMTDAEMDRFERKGLTAREFDFHQRPFSQWLHEDNRRQHSRSASKRFSKNHP